MALYDLNSEKKLIEKTNYELWYLNYISNCFDIIDGDSFLTSFEFYENEEKVKINVNIICSASVGAQTKDNAWGYFGIFTFISSFKIIDMIVEWILEENRNAGIINDVPWRFKEKQKAIKNKKLIWPIKMTKPYLKDRLLSLFNKLTEYRNEIVHSHNFIVNDKLIKINKGLKNLSFDRMQLGAFVRVVCTILNVLTGTQNLDERTEPILKSCLDNVQHFHGLPLFNEKIPLIIDVKYFCEKHDGKYTINIKRIKDKLSVTYPSRIILFNLIINDMTNKKSYRIPCNEVTKNDIYSPTEPNLIKYSLI